MEDLRAFFAENIEEDGTEEVAVSPRFKDAAGQPLLWKLRPIPEAENEEIRKAATRYSKGKNGTRVSETNPESYMAMLVVASVVYPDLKNVELQKSYGVLSADHLVKKMLLSGEYASLVGKIQEINGFDRDINQMADEIKN